MIPENGRIPSHYQSLKKPNDDMGGDTYANPVNYTDVPAFTKEESNTKKEEEGTTNFDDREYVILEQTNLDDDESADNGGASTEFEDTEYFTLEPPPQDDREYCVSPDAQGSPKEGKGHKIQRLV